MSAQIPLFEHPPVDGDIGSVEVWAVQKQLRYVVGVDEAGRGPLAGPVVAGAALLPQVLPPSLKRLNDSKKLTEAVREELFDQILSAALATGIGVVSPQIIDEINILQASQRAMLLAVEELLKSFQKPVDALFVDGNLTLPHYQGTQWALVKGDSRSWSIAAGSILAKVTRDRIMVRADDEYPEYGFAKHKGYGTIEHRRALAEYGPCAQHRKSFRWRRPQ